MTTKRIAMFFITTVTAVGLAGLAVFAASGIRREKPMATETNSANSNLATNTSAEVTLTNTSTNNNANVEADGSETVFQKITKKIPVINAITESNILSAKQPPFIAQAPFGDWEDPRQQDGCEEASLIMAWHWQENTTFSKEQGLEEILTLTEFSKTNIGEWRSTSAADTTRLFNEYYNKNSANVRYDITTDGIKAEIEKGNLVIVPVDGTVIGNPYYKAPGPPEHMIVIYGYDTDDDEFLTNDPGTRHGSGYRYKTAALANSLRDYPTGHQSPITETRTAMIVIMP